MPLPTWANLGPANGGVGAITVNYPVNYATNDIAILICQSSNETVTETSGGWTEKLAIGIGIPGAAGSTKLTVFWKRVTNGGAEAPAQLADAGDHVNGIIAIIRGCVLTGDPFDIVSSGSEVADTSLVMTGPVTTIDECLVLAIAVHSLDTLNPEWSGESASALTSLIERYDHSITIGNGGGTAIWSGNKAVAGDTGTISATGLAATAKAWAVLALIPKPRVLNENPIPSISGPWQYINPGAGGTWSQASAGPTGVIAVGSDIGGLYLSTNRGNSWIGCGNKQGLNDQFIHAVGFDPTNGAIIYAATSRGVYRTADTGTTWTLVTSQYWIGDVVPAPSNANIVYAAYHPTQTDTNTGILKSVDRGLTWAEVVDDLPVNLQICRLIVHPTNPDILYLVSSYHDFNHTPDDSIFKSVNAGVNWVRVSAALEAVGKIWDCVIDNSTPTTLWATIYTGDPYTAPYTYAGFAYKSIDSGANWTQMCAHTGNVMVKRNNSNTIWIIDNKRTQGATEEGFWESTDGGTVWNKKSTLSDYDFGWQANADRAYGAGNYGIPHGFGQDLSDPNSIFQVSPQFVHGSFDAGLVFHNLYTKQVTPNFWTTRRLENLTVADIRICESLNGLIYAGSFDLGIWKSLNNGLSWIQCNSPDFTGDWNGEGGNTTTIMPDPEDSNVVWAAQGRTSTTANLVKNINQGEAGSWFATSGMPLDQFIYGLSLDKTSPVGSRTLFVTCGDNDGKFHAVPNGSPITGTGIPGGTTVTPEVLEGATTLTMSANATLTQSDVTLVINGVSVHHCNTTIGLPTVTRTSRAGDVYKSIDGGLTWSIVLKPTPNAAARVTAIDAANHSLIYAGGEGGFWRSINGGATWSHLSTPADFTGTTTGNGLGALRWTGVAWIEADPTIGNRVYVACYGDTGANRGLYVSEDAGSTWTKIYTADYVRRVAVHPTNSAHVYLASARTMSSPGQNSYLSKGILRSTDYGQTWRDINENLPWTLVGPIAIGFGGDAYDIFIGTTGNGFFARTFSSGYYTKVARVKRNVSVELVSTILNSESLQRLTISDTSIRFKWLWLCGHSPDCTIFDDSESLDIVGRGLSNMELMQAEDVYSLDKYKSMTLSGDSASVLGIGKLGTMTLERDVFEEAHYNIEESLSSLRTGYVLDFRFYNSNSNKVEVDAIQALLEITNLE